MKIMHRTVGFIEAKGNVSRAGEGAFVRLQNGDIMLAYTEYDTADFEDDASANLAAVFSSDEGETWGNHRILLRKKETENNVMSISFLRLPNGDLMLFYLKKQQKNGAILCQPCVRRSKDDGKSFQEEVVCGPRDKYYVVNNDRVVRLRSGRILIPAAVYDPPKVGTSLIPDASVCFIVSDDDGQTWYEQKNESRLPIPYQPGPEEPGLYEHEDGTIWCYMRTQLGCQWQMMSYDGAETWTIPQPNMYFTSPPSPMLVKKVCNVTVAIFNPIPNYVTRNGALWGRTPLVMAISRNDGKGHGAEDFPIIYPIEEDPTNNYCYPAILDGGDYFLLAYYHSNGSNCPLNSLKILKLYIDD